MKKGLLLIVVLLPFAAAAETVTYEFAGAIKTINFNDNDAFPEGYIGQPFSGWFRYSSDSHISEIGAIAFSIGSFQSDVIDERLLAIEWPTYLYLSYYDRQGDYHFGRTGLTLTDNTGQAFENDSQVMTALSLPLFDEIEFQIEGFKKQGETIVGNFQLGGQVTALNLIPEPASIILMLTGGACLLCKRK